MSRLSIGRDTTLCMSLAARPGTFGSRFHNHLYQALGLDWIYKAFTTQDLNAAIAGIRALGIRGCAISMPFKEACIPILDQLAPSASAVASVNTIVNDRGRLVGHNTDYAAVHQLLAELPVARDAEVVLFGSGGMAKAVARALRELGFSAVSIVARNAQTGRALAELCGHRYAARVEVQAPALLINATPVGMAGGPEASELPCDAQLIARAQAVFEVVAMPAETPLVRAARAHGKQLVVGAQVLVLQALGQFVLYTGHTPSQAQVQAAAQYALSG